jgi:hypothetical protein
VISLEMNPMLHIAANSTHAYDGDGKSADAKGGHLSRDIAKPRNDRHELSLRRSFCFARSVVRGVAGPADYR